MSVDPNIFFSQSLNAMNAYFRQKSLSENIGSAFLLMWWIGGMLEDPYLFLISMIVTFILFLNGFFLAFNEKITITPFVTGAFRRMIFGLWAQGMYTGGKTPGPESITIAEFTIEITLFSALIVSFFAIFWFAAKFFDRIDLDDPFYSPNTLLLVFRGLLRGVLLVGLFYSVFTSGVIEGLLETILFWAYIVEPAIAYYQATYEDTLDAVRINAGLGKVPIAELRSVMLTNSFLLIFSMWFKGIAGEEWNLLRTAYILLSVIAFITAMYTIREYNKNPFARSMLASMLGSTGESLENIDLASQMGYVIPDSFNIQDRMNELKLLKDSILIPIGEEKGKVKSIIVGKSEYLMQSNEQLMSKLVDGVSTTFLSKRDFKRLKKDITPTSLGDLNLEKLQLPSLDQIQKTLNLLAFSMGSWLSNLRNELSKIDLSNYGITDKDGITEVRLPAINVYDSPGLTKVNVMGIKVIDTPEYTNVRLGSWLSVLDVPKFTLVNLAGLLTVLDVQGEGTAVDILGFKISDGIDANKLREFQEALSREMEKFNNYMDSDVGKILLEKDAHVLMSVGWDGEFSPLLQGSKDAFGEHPALVPSKDINLLPGKTQKIDSELSTLLGITGKTKKEVEAEKREARKAKRAKKKEKNFQVNVKFGTISVSKTKSDSYNEIADEIDSAMESRDDEHTDFIDAEYEVIDAASLKCMACGNSQAEGKFCLECGSAITP